MSAQSSAAKHLRRLWKTLPLSKLQQGSTLAIQSTVPLKRIDIRSEWRDDGNAQLEHIFDITKTLSLVDFTVTQQADQMTSLERIAPHFTISLDETGDDDTSIEITETSATGDDHEGTTLSVQVPEKLNLKCHLEEGGSIHVSNKIEGDIYLSTARGHIQVKKVRGHEIQLQNQQGSIHSTGLIEAQNVSMEATGGRIRAKQIHGTSIQLVAMGGETTPEKNRDSEDRLSEDDEGSMIDVSSMYISGLGGATAKVQNMPHLQRRAVRIKTAHGPVRVETYNVGQPITENPFLADETTPSKPQQTKYPLVELGGVNGNCEVEIKSLAKENDDENDQDWTSCKIHVDSLSPDSVSLVTADRGNVHLTLDRKVESDLRFLSLLPSTSNNDDFLTESSALLADEEDPQQIVNILQHLPGMPGLTTYSPTDANRRISIETKAFTARPDVEKLIHRGSDLDQKVEYVDGWVDNKSYEPDSRFDTKLKREAAVLHETSGGGGKIRIDAAADQALFGFGADNKSSHLSNDDKSEDEDEDPSMRPLMAVVSTGKIQLETLSWVGAIARRYGMGSDSHRGLGRQATRKPRILSEDENAEQVSHQT